jgi:hypothetical protein
MISWTPTSVTINDDSYDADFRVESNGQTHMLFVDAGNDGVGIGTSAVDHPLEVLTTANDKGIVLKDSDNDLVIIQRENEQFGRIRLLDATSSRIDISARGDQGFKTLSVPAVFNEDGGDNDFRVESDGNTHMLFVDASSSEVGIGTNDPRKTLDIAGELQVRKAALIASPKTITYTGDTDAWDSGGAVQHTLQHYYIAAPTAQQYRKIAVLPASSSVTGEKLKIRVFISALQESDYYEYDIVIGQRNNFAAMLFNAQGTSSSYKSIAGIKCYTQTDGSTDVYMWTASGAGYYYGFTAECWADGFAQTADLISPADVVTINTVPTGTLVFDSTNDTYHKTRFYVSEGTVNVNDGGQDIDFRVESDNNANALFVDAGNDQVVVGTSTPITGVGAAMTIGGLSDTRLAIDGSTSSGLYLTDSGAQGITIRNASGDLEFYGITTREFVFNAGSIDTDFRVESDGNANMLVVDAAQNVVGIRDADTTLNGSLVSRGEGTYSSGNIAGLFYANSGNRGTIRIRSLDNDSAECAFDVNGALRWMISTRPSNDAQGAYCMKWYPASGTPGYGIVGGNVMTLTQSGDLTINGALSKGSGSFRIKHPLPEKNATHDLVHSFVEAPQADNIYRGKVALVAGQASVNIDTVAGMTEGTFAALNREVQCFTSNETGWTAVRGSVSGNILAIEAQDNTCTDTISWMVIGERQDEHMYDTNWTDENGKVIVEPLRPAGSDDPS